MDEKNKVSIEMTKQMGEGLESGGMSRRERRERAERLAAQQAAKRAAAPIPEIETPLVADSVNDVSSGIVEIQQPTISLGDLDSAAKPAAVEPAVKEVPAEPEADDVDEPTREFKPLSRRAAKSKSDLFSFDASDDEEDDEDEDNEDTSEVDDETDFISDESLHVLQLFTLMSAYDLYALSNDDAGREQLLKDYPESMALTLMNAANMIHEGRLRSAYMLAQGFLLSSRDTEDVDIDARHNGLLPDLLPHGWHTIMECCAEGLNDVGLLANVYRYYILSCNDRSDTHYVSKLRNLLRIYGGLSAEEWHDVADGLARDCARNIIDRIKYQPEITTKGGTQRHSSWRNPAYEKLIVDERLSDTALTYCVMVDTRRCHCCAPSPSNTPNQQNR